MIKEDKRFISSCVFEGMVSFRAVVAGIESGITDRRIERVIFDKERKAKLAKHLSYVKAMSYKYGFELAEVDSDEIDRLAVGSSHGGILCFTSDRTLPSLDDVTLKENGFYMMLDGIEDPYNFGYAMRSIYAAGVDGVILSERNWMSAAGVVCRASAGASEMLDVYVASSDDMIEKFKNADYKIACADIENSVSVYDTSLEKPLLLCIGGEKRGISKTVLESADIIVRLDYGRNFPQALSAASAASILAFEVLRDNRN